MAPIILESPCAVVTYLKVPEYCKLAQSAVKRVKEWGKCFGAKHTNQIEFQSEISLLPDLKQIMKTPRASACLSIKWENELWFKYFTDLF